MTWLVLACYVATAYLSGAAVIAVLARLAGLPWSLCRLAGIAWGPVMAWVIWDARRKR